MELTPRTLDEERPAPRRRRAPLTVALVVLLVGALGFVVWKGLSNATLYFRNADEAVADRQELGDRRFRLQGTVQDGTVQRDGERVRFVVAFNDVEVDVVHEGDPPELFRPGIAVVLEGHWGDGEVFESDSILVKHSNEYRAEDEYDERVDAAEDGGGAEAGDSP